MHFPPIWRGRRNNDPVRSRTAQFRAILRAAQSIEGYRETLRRAGLDTLASVNQIRDIDEALPAFTPLPLRRYNALFTQRRPACRHLPYGRETRSAFLLPYADARKGLDACPPASASRVDLYGPHAIAAASTDLVNLSRALSASSTIDWNADHAIVVVCGMEAGLMTEAQRDTLWEMFQVPAFQQFVGTDGRVIAAECEVHAGLHIRPENAVIETLAGELLITSLTDEQAPALRMQSGLSGTIDREACECGRSEPRIVGLRSVSTASALAASA
jgi:hypothetical protein